MSVKTGLHEAALGYLRTRGVEADRVTEVTNRIEYGGFCETCSYEELVVDIEYRVADQYRSYRYYGTFAEFIRALDGD